MTNYRRMREPGGTYFFTVVTARRRPLFDHPGVIHRLRSAFQYARRRAPFRMDAVVILPDHLHVIWTFPDGDVDYSLRWRLIKYRFSLSMPRPGGNNRSAQKRREKGVWQRRFWEHLVRDEDDFLRHMDYVHFNPVKHGYVSRPVDWPLSSLHREVRRGRYPQDWGASLEPRRIRGMKVE